VPGSERDDELRELDEALFGDSAPGGPPPPPATGARAADAARRGDDDEDLDASLFGAGAPS
jgi:hypothetical protein